MDNRCAFDVFDNENFIPPKSMHLCMIRVIANTSIDGGPERQQEVEHIVPKGAREEREACARGKDEGKDAREEGKPNRHPGRPSPGSMPAPHPSKPAHSPVYAGFHAGSGLRA